MHSISPDQSRAARRELGASQADVASALNLNRQYLSEFENGHTSRLTSNQLKKLRTFYETKIQEANKAGEEITLTFGEIEDQRPPKIEEFSVKRLTLNVADEFSVSVLGKTLDLVQDNDARIAALFQQEAARENGFTGPGEFTSNTIESLQEIFGLLSFNYVLYRSLGGWPAMKIPPSADGLETLRDIVFDTYKTQLEAVGLLVAPVIEPAESEEVAE